MPRIIPDVLKNLFSKPATLKYPYERREMPERCRGMPAVDRDKCISCGACADVCPASAITYDEEDKPRVDLGQCIYCAECAQICPTEAITMSIEYELAVYDRAKAISE